VWYPVKVVCIRYNLFAGAETRLGLGMRPPNWGKGWDYGVKNGPIRKCNICFLLAPHSDQRAISNRFHRIQQRYRRTDRPTDRIDIAFSRSDAKRYALASIALKPNYLQTIHTGAYFRHPCWKILDPPW
jgi:hypothetical protein